MFKLNVPWKTSQGENRMPVNSECKNQLHLFKYHTIEYQEGSVKTGFTVRIFN